MYIYIYIYTYIYIYIYDPIVQVSETLFEHEWMVGHLSECGDPAELLAP